MALNTCRRDGLKLQVTGEGSEVVPVEVHCRSKTCRRVASEWASHPMSVRSLDETVAQAAAGEHTAVGAPSISTTAVNYVSDYLYCNAMVTRMIPLRRGPPPLPMLSR